MDHTLVITTLVLIFGFYMAWNIGANDVSNAMGTSVGSGALTLRRAVIIAAILEFSGAFFLGSSVSQTLQNGLVEIEAFQNHHELVLGMCAALLGTGVWLQVASYFGWPVSTTHAIVGAIVGFGALIGGKGAVHWAEVARIASSWVLSPLASGVIAFILFNLVRHTIFFSVNPIRAARRLFPFLLFVSLSTFSLSMLIGGLKNINLSLHISQAICIAFLIGLIGALIGYLFLKRKTEAHIDEGRASIYSPENVICLEKAVKHLRRVRLGKDEESKEIFNLMRQVKSITDSVKQSSPKGQPTSEFQVVEKLFVYLQIISACFIAFAHGANDVANAIGPVAAVINILKSGSNSATAAIPLWLLLLGGSGIVLGLATWGWRVIETIGKKITELTPTRGFCAEFGAATTILLASKLGLPVSTTHCLVGAVFGVGMAHGIRALNLNMISEIIISWVVTIPVSAFMCIAFFYLLKLFL